MGGGGASRPMSPAGSLSTSIPKTGAALMEASMGGSASTSSVAAPSMVSNPSSTLLPPIVPPTASHAATRCPNCGHLVHGPGMSPGGLGGIGGALVVGGAPLSYSHSLAPVCAVGS